MKAGLVILTCLAFVIEATTANAPACSSVYSNWVNNYAVGERLNYLKLHATENPTGHDSQLYCMVKGQHHSDEVLTQ